MTIARCKFRVFSVESHEWGDQVNLYTEYDENDPEDTRFAIATPSGSMEFLVSNPNLVGAFQSGRQTYYVDLTPVQEG